MKKPVKKLKKPFRIAIISKSKKDLPEIKRLLKEQGFSFSTKKPEMVICHGGDGTLLIGEHKYPGVPKIALRNSLTCIKCDDVPLKEVFKKIINKEFFIEEHKKLEVNIYSKNKKNNMVCLNDFILRNSNISRAIRFSLKINDKTIHRLIIGDGLVVSTPFGSTAYFKNITKTSFKEGFGLAYNNTNLREKTLFLDDDDVIELELIRGPADASADHQLHPKQLDEKARIIINKSKEIAKIIRLK